jgi:hypothetical protein
LAPSDSLSILAALFGVSVIVLVLALALVAALICHDLRRPSASPPAADVLTEPAVDARGLVLIAAVVFAVILAASQVIHWAVS